MDTEVIEILATADKFLVEKKALGNHYMRVRVALGELLIEQAKAEGERLRREAMTGFGGDLIVALEAARNINLADVMVSTRDVDLLNVREMVNKLGGEIGQEITVDPAKELSHPSQLPEILKLPEEIEKEIKGALPKPDGGHSLTPEDVPGDSKYREEAGDIYREPTKHQDETNLQRETEQPEETLKSKNPLSRVPNEMGLDNEWEGFTKEYQISQ